MSLSVTVNEIVSQSHSLLLAKHETWSRVPIGAIANVLNGFAFSSERFEREKGTPLIRIRDLLGNKTDCLYNGDFDNTYLVNTGDLLIGMDGDFNCTLWKGLPGLLNQRVCKVELKQNFFDLKFLFYLLPGYLNEINRATSSVTVKHLSSKSVEEIPLPLPPLLEQQRIVEAIEQQFSRLDEGVALLRQAQKKLKLYRVSVLKAAVEGELTAEWRKSHPDVEPASELLKRILAERRAKWEEEQIAKGRDLQKVKYVEPVEPDVSGLPELPEEWCWATIGQVTECLDYKRVPINKEERAKRSGSIPYYGANGQVGWINDYIFNEPLVLVVEDETFTGREIPFSYKIAGEAWVNNHAHVLQPTTIIHIDYLNYSLAYYPFTPLTQGTTGRRKLTQKALILAPYPLPPKEEQEQIVSLVEERLSIIDELESAIKKGLKQAERQRQSILQRAFTGKLVAQDPSDEPASVLLERIKREREEQAGRREGRKVKNNQSKKSVARPTRVVSVPEREAEPLDVAGLKQESLWREEMEEQHERAEQHEPEEVEVQGALWRNLES